MLNKNYEKILKEGISFFNNKELPIDQIPNLYKDSFTFYELLKKSNELKTLELFSYSLKVFILMQKGVVSQEKGTDLIKEITFLLNCPENQIQEQEKAFDISLKDSKNFIDSHFK